MIFIQNQYLHEITKLYNNPQSQLALYVLSFLEAKDLLSAAQTCSYWHTLAEDNLLWKEKCHEEG